MKESIRDGLVMMLMGMICSPTPYKNKFPNYRGGQHVV
jgi:hypothetical protein